MVSRESILAAKTIATEPLDVPEYGGTVYFKAMSAAERVDFFDSLQPAASSVTRMGCLLIVRSMVDEAGNRLLADDDAAALEQQDAELVNRLAEAANRVNKIDELSKERRAKKSEASASASGSDSHGAAVNPTPISSSNG